MNIPRIRFLIKKNKRRSSGKSKPVVRVFATLALSAAVGAKIWQIEAIKGSSCNKKLMEAAENLHNVSFNSSSLYPSKSMTQERVVDIGEAVEKLLGESILPETILSMVMAGLCDIENKCSIGNKEYISVVITAIRSCIDCYLKNEDDEFEDEGAFEKYNNWLEYLENN